MAKESITSNVALAMAIAVPICGVATAWISHRALKAAYGALDDLKVLYLQVDPSRRRHWVRPFGRAKWHQDGKVLARHLPKVIMGTWILLVILVGLFHIDGCARFIRKFLVTSAGDGSQNNGTDRSAGPAAGGCDRLPSGAAPAGTTLARMWAK